MSEEQASALEEAFVDNNFDLGEDADTVTQNYNIASDLYQKYLEQVDEFVEDILDGLVVDVSSAVFAIQNLCLAQKYRDLFEREKNNLCTMVI